MHDLIIIGAGPAGLSAGIFAGRRGLKTLILSDPDLPSQATLAPRVDDYPGLPNISGMELVKKMKEHALSFGVEFREERVLGVKKQEDGFRVVTSSTEYPARALIFATGAKHRKAEIPGEERFLGKGVSYCASCDGPLFAGKRVLVIGGGDTAVTSAIYLHDLGARVTLVHRRDQLRAAESLQKELEKKGIEILWNSVVKEIKGENFVSSAVIQDVKTGETRELETQGIFILIGTVPVSELARNLGLELENGFIKVDERQKTNLEGVWAAGDCCTRPSKKIAVAAGDGAVAAEEAYKWLKGF